MIARLEQRVYKRMIAYRFPEIRNVPCTNSGLSIKPHFAREYSAMVARYIGRKAFLPLGPLFRSGAGLGRESRDLNDDFRVEPKLVESILRPLLRAGIFPASIYNLRAIDEMIENHYQYGCKHQHVLSLLISWGLATQFFLHEDFPDVPEAMFAAA